MSAAAPQGNMRLPLLPVILSCILGLALEEACDSSSRGGGSPATAPGDPTTPGGSGTT